MKDDYQKKPPIGLIPQLIYLVNMERIITGNGGMDIHDLIMNRFRQITKAIHRYEAYPKEIPTEWQFELELMLENYRVFLNHPVNGFVKIKLQKNSEN